jgi:hypothetical protein
VGWRVRAQQTLAPVGRTLLARLVPLGSRLQRWLRDRGFDRVRGMRALRTGVLPGSRPAVQRGPKPPTPGGLTGPEARVAEQPGRWTATTWRSAPEGQGALVLAVVWHNTRGQRGRPQREALWSAPRGVQHRPWSGMRATSRGRLGIASSSRQVQQARCRPRRRHPVVRRVLVGGARSWRHGGVGGMPQAAWHPGVGPSRWGRNRGGWPVCGCGCCWKARTMIDSDAMSRFIGTYTIGRKRLASFATTESSL